MCVCCVLYVCVCVLCVVCVNLPSPQVILGVTNPFFAKALDHWPHIIKAADHTSSTSNGAGEREIWCVHCMCVCVCGAFGV